MTSASRTPEPAAGARPRSPGQRTVAATGPEWSAEDEPLLVERLRAGSEAAYRELIERHGARMLAAARKLLRNEEDARDAVQEAFLSAFKALGGFDGRSRLSTWLHRIVVNAALMKLRARQSRIHEEIEELLPEFVGKGVFGEAQRPWCEMPEDPLSREELCNEVHAAIACLPETYRVPLLLRDIEGMTNQDLARELGVTVNAAKIRVHRARLALRTLLAPRMESLVS